MSIPKVIHYCWFGGAPLPKLARKCIQSWQKYCPDYQIVCWDESNFDYSENRYAREAYEAGKWAFVSDYARLKVLYEHGGIYLDTDVELIRALDDLLDMDGFMGFEPTGFVSTGLGFACKKGCEAVRCLLADYDTIPFVLPDGTFDMTPCPNRNTQKLQSLGFDARQRQQVFMGIRLLPEDFLCPVDYYTGKKNITNNTHSIHHYSASWTSKRSKRTTKLKRIIGVKLYEKLYGKFLYKCKWLEW